MPTRKKPHAPARLGRWLARLPASRWLPPLRLAGQLYLQEYEPVLPGLPEALDGLTIAYASDIHYGAYLNADRVRDLAERMNALEADILLLGGDYGEDTATALACWEILPPLRARLGTYAVMGNHDRAEGGLSALIQAMENRGVTPIVNGAARLRVGDSTLALCATDDYDMGEPDYEKTARAAAGADFVIYAPHSPDALAPAYALQEPPFFQLAVCGHTHGGQVAVFGFAPRSASRLGWRYGTRYRTGLLREKGVTVIVSNGVGTSWLPVRLGVPPQYHRITLRKAEKGKA